MYTYDSSFFDYTTQSALRSAEAVIAAVRALLPADRVLDVGCAQGAWLKVWHDTGSREVQGLDGAYVDTERLLIPRDCFTAHDLATPFSLSRRFDIAQSLEVAEHLPGARAQGFVDDLVAHAPAVLFSAAPPGQGGEHHVHERPYEYWRDLFAARGYQLVDAVRPVLLSRDDVSPWYRHNTFLFVDDASFASLHPYAKLLAVPRGAAVADVSSPMYQARKRVIRALPAAVQQLAARVKARMP